MFGWSQSHHHRIVADPCRFIVLGELGWTASLLSCCSRNVSQPRSEHKLTVLCCALCHSVLGIIHRYEAIKKMSPEQRKSVVPRVCVIGGKAAPGYEMAKRIIKLVRGFGLCVITLTVLV